MAVKKIKTIYDVLCPFCGTLCDDLEVDIAENKIYNLEGDEKVTIKQIVDTVDEIIGGVKVEYKEGRKGDFKGKNILNQKAKNELGWFPKITFKEGMKKYIEWYKQNNN